MGENTAGSGVVGSVSVGDVSAKVVPLRQSLMKSKS